MKSLLKKTLPYLLTAVISTAAAIGSTYWFTAKEYNKIIKDYRTTYAEYRSEINTLRLDNKELEDANFELSIKKEFWKERHNKLLHTLDISNKIANHNGREYEKLKDKYTSLEAAYQSSLNRSENLEFMIENYEVPATEKSYGIFALPLKFESAKGVMPNKPIVEKIEQILELAIQKKLGSIQKAVGPEYVEVYLLQINTLNGMSELRIFNNQYSSSVEIVSSVREGNTLYAEVIDDTFIDGMPDMHIVNEYNGNVLRSQTTTHISKDDFIGNMNKYLVPYHLALNDILTALNK